nr:MAG TPA: Prophenoloxidase activating proteinase [Caudoviricetes sp.]
MQGLCVKINRCKTAMGLLALYFNKTVNYA